LGVRPPAAEVASPGFHACATNEPCRAVKMAKGIGEEGGEELLARPRMAAWEQVYVLLLVRPREFMG